MADLSLKRVAAAALAGSLCLAAAAGASAQTAPRPALKPIPAKAELDATGKENLKVVEAFVKGFEAPDAEKMAAMFADDGAMSFDEKKPPVVGHDAILASLKSILPAGRRYRIDLVGVPFAEGRIVTGYREDYTYRADGSLSPVRKVVGVFIVEGGKIKYWQDYAAY